MNIGKNGRNVHVDQMNITREISKDTGMMHGGETFSGVDILSISIEESQNTKVSEAKRLQVD